MKDLLEFFNDHRTTTGQIIRAFRKNFLITLKDLSAATGIPESHLSAIENDKVDIGVKRASLIAAALGIEPQFLLFPNGDQPYQKEVEQVKKRAAKIFKEKKRRSA